MEQDAMDNKKGAGGSFLPASIVAAAVILGGAWIYTTGMKATPNSTSGHEGGALAPQEVELPVAWGDLGVRMAEAGVIDRKQFEAVYAARGGLPMRERELLAGTGNGKVVMDRENAGVLLNLFWALGLGNKNRILEEGPMMSPQYGGLAGAGRFASTGGWTLARPSFGGQNLDGRAKGDPSTELGASAMQHYSKHVFFALTGEQQARVEEMAKNIYRPCCDNSTYFPDCNHGMAMLGLLEFLASGGATEEEMYRAALAVNAFWFPDEYATIAKYLASQGKAPANAAPKEVLGADYSSISGFRNIASRIPRGDNQPTGGCGV